MTLEQKLNLLRLHDVNLREAPGYGRNAYASVSKNGEVDVVYAGSLEAAADELIKFFKLKR